MDTGAYLGKKGWIQGHILGEITDLEFGPHGFLMNHVFLPTEQVETNICLIIYQDATFKICLSLFGWKVNIVPKMHIVQCLANSVCGHFSINISVLPRTSYGLIVISWGPPEAN